MKKFRKITAFIVALFTLILFSGAIAACSGSGEKNPPDKPPSKETYYTVTVVLEDDSPVANATVTFEKTEEEGEPSSFKTDESGVAHIDLPRDYYLVRVTDGMPAGYSMEESEGYYTVNTGRTFTIKLVRASETGTECTVRLKAPRGASASILRGRAITYSQTADGGQQRLGTTDEKGEATVIVPGTGYLFVTPPSEYNYDRNYTETSPYRVTSKTTSVTFEFLRARTLMLDNEMTAEDKRLFANAIGGNSFSSDTFENGENRNAYLFSATLEANETQFFSFRAAESDLYTLYVNRTPNVEVATLGESFAVNTSPNKTVLPDRISIGSDMICEKDHVFTLYMKAGNAGETVTFAVVAPAEKNETSIKTEGTHSAQILENLPALIAFRPKTQGKYQFKITSAGNYTIEYIANRYSTSATETVTSKQYEVNITDATLYYTDSKGNIDYTNPSSAEWLFRVSTPDNVSKPHTFDFEITRLGDPDAGRGYDIQFAPQPAAGTLTAAQRPQGNMTVIGINKTAQRIVRGSDGRYYLNALTGPLVYVKLQGMIPPYYSDRPFEQIDTDGAMHPYRFNVTTQEEMEDPTHPYVLRDYTKLLRGYMQDKNEQGTYEEYYLKYVNADGLYPLDDTLKEFLTYFAQDNRYWISSFGAATENSLYLFSAYYYDDGTPLPAPVPSAGNGTQESPYEVEIGNYSVTATAGTPVYLLYTGDGIVTVHAESGKVIPGTVEAGGTFTLEADGTVIITVNYVPGTHASNPIAITNGDMLTVTKNGVWYTFTAQESGMYDFSFNSSAVSFYNADGSVAALNGLLLKADNKVIFRAATEEDSVELTVTIEKNAIVTNTPESGDGSAYTPYVLEHLGLYGAEAEADKILHYTIEKAGRYTLSSDDDNIRVALGSRTYTGNVYVSFTVEAGNGILFDISSITGNDVLYFTLSELSGYDEAHAIEISMEENETVVSDQVYIEGEYNESTEKYIALSVYYTFTAPADGLYIVTFSGADALLTVLTAQTRYVFEYATNTYRIVLNQGENVRFTLSATTTSYPYRYTFTITKNVMPALGSKDLPETAEKKDYTHTLAAGERYYYAIEDLNGFKVVPLGDTDKYKVYDLGSSSFNDDRIDTEHELYPLFSNEIRPNETVKKWYIVVIAQEDCEAVIRFA